MGDTGTAGHLQLYLLSLPDGKIQPITALTNARTEPGPDAMPGDPPMEASRAMTDLDSSLEWSPDGSVLAFIGAQAGSSADLYTYTLDTGKVAHLTDGPSQAFRPSWSPLGTYIVHFGATTFGTGAGYAVTGAWAVPANGSAVIDLYKPPSGDQVLVGWLSDDDFVVYSWTPVCGPQDLRVFHIPDKSEEQLVDGCFSGAAVALDGSVLVAAGGQDPDWKGVYRFAPGSLELSRISVDAAESAQFRPYSGDFVAGERVYSAEGNEMARARRSIVNIVWSWVLTERFMPGHVRLARRGYGSMDRDWMSARFSPLPPQTPPLPLTTRCYFLAARISITPFFSITYPKK